MAPGVWLWEQSPTSLLARYASIRSARSFGLSFPKVYIDGIAECSRNGIQWSHGLARVLVRRRGRGWGGPNDGRHVAFVLQNVGEITNHGWEIAGSAGIGGLAVSTAFAIVESRLTRLSTGYDGDLRPGDRMLEVPERTLSATAGYARGPLSASLTGSRAFEWVNYDRSRWLHRWRLPMDCRVTSSACSSGASGASI